jgi:phosphoribosylglycinamide formyltransferase-1
LGAGETKTGSTIHLVDEGLDTGPILGQETVPIRKDDTPDDLLERIKVAERKLYPRVIREYAATL